MPGQHARFSPSGAEGWSACADWASDPTGSDYANWGTAAHEIAETAYTQGKPASAYLGRIVMVDGKPYEVDAEMVECVQAYLDLAPHATTILVEQRLPITQITGEDDAHGTSDRIALAGNVLYVDDLKTGKGVRVDAEQNKQMAIYAQAAVDQFSLVHDFDTVTMRIIQPRLDHISEWTLPVEALAEFVGRIKPATEVRATEDGCRWCAKKGTCATLRAAMTTTFEAVQPVGDASATALAGALSRLDLMEAWMKAVRAEAERRLLAGEEVPGYKIVEGKKGARAWDDEATVEGTLKSMRLRQDEMYQFKLMSPTQLEKALAKEHPKQWARLQEHITQKSGGPAVVPITDKRPPLATAVCSSEFTPITA